TSLPSRWISPARSVRSIERAGVRLFAKLGRVEFIFGGAELAIHADRPVMGALLDLLLREACEYLSDLLARAGAIVDHVSAVVDAHSMFVEQAKQQSLRADRGID